jgi:hypothetical protein
MAVALPLAKEQFNEQEQIKFKQSVAHAAGVSSDDVTIDDIRSVYIRRMLTVGIRVDTSVMVLGESTAKAIWTRLTADSINSALIAAGLPAVTILAAPTLESAHPAAATPPPATPTPLINTQSTSTALGVSNTSTQQIPSSTSSSDDIDVISSEEKM